MKKLATILCVLISMNTFSQVHTTYLWHLQQPIYWPEKSIWNPHRYQTVRESDYLKFNGGNMYSDGQAHPLNNLSDIFGNDDRKAVYQYRAKDAVQSLLGFPEAGAQVNYSGVLIENVNSLAGNNQWGYSSGWQNSFVEARGWTTSGGKPRLDVVGFTFHHVIAPLVNDRVFRKELQTHKYIYGQTFGTAPLYSKGYWPAECSFSERNIKILAEEGFEWSVIANSRLSRTLKDYPLSFGTNGCNIDPPNKADVTEFLGNNWWSGQIDGRGGKFAAPFCYQAHKAKYVDPENGTEHNLTVVPMCDLLSYQNGYSTMGTGDIDAHIAPYNNSSQPCIVLMAHDGDNAWGGGASYYGESVPGFAGSASSQGYVPTTIQQFLTDHPVPANDIVHVEDGSWINAANDWGHPQFINWIWPFYDANYNFNPNGWTEDARNWALLTAAENHVIMAEDLDGNADIADIVNPSANSSNVEKAWHFLLPGFASCYMYYGASLDMEVKQTIACNNAIEYADAVIDAHPGVDNTAPSVFIPQRWPYNPGGIAFGPTSGYQQRTNPSDFFVWTFAYDVSGIQNAVLKYRVDFDGTNPLDNNENDTYAGGTGVSEWLSIPMTLRIFPTGNITNNPEINFFVLPDYIADQYYAQIIDLHDTLVDYFVEVTDIKGNITKTAIQHVYIGASNTGGNDEGVQWSPSYPTLNDTITITVNNATQGAFFHWGVNNNGSTWQQAHNAYWPTGSSLFNGTGPATQSAMNGPSNNALTLKIGPFNNAAQVVNQVAFVIHYNDNSWDNNNGHDYHIPINQNPTAIPEHKTISIEGINVYPNPFTDNAVIEFLDSHDRNYMIEIINAFGQIIFSQNISENRFVFERKNIEKGVYYIRALNLKTNKVLVKKIVIV